MSMAIEAACCRSLLLRRETIKAGENNKKAIAAYEKSKVTTMAFNKQTGKRVEIGQLLKAQRAKGDVDGLCVKPTRTVDILRFDSTVDAASLTVKGKKFAVRVVERKVEDEADDVVAANAKDFFKQLQATYESEEEDEPAEEDELAEGEPPADEWEEERQEAATAAKARIVPYVSDSNESECEDSDRECSCVAWQYLFHKFCRACVS